MDKKLEKLEVQKLLQEYSFLKVDDEYKKEVIAAGKEEFMKKVYEKNGSTPPPKPQTKEGEEEVIKSKKIDPKSIDPKVRKKIKKLYREIAKLTHPDKVDSDELVGLYHEATVAADEFDLFTIYSVCAQLNISHSLDKEDIGVLKIHIIDKREKLEDIEKSFIWLYTQAKSEEKKEELINLFVKNYGEEI